MDLLLRLKKSAPALITALVLIVAPIAVTAGVVLSALGTVNEMRTTLETRLETIARLDVVVAEGQRATQSTPDAALQALKADFLAGGEDPIVIAELQNRIRSLAMANSVELNSANTLASRTHGALTYLGLHVVMRGQLSELQRVLHALETGTPLLFVERAAIRLDSWPIKSSDPARDGMPALVAELDIFGARLPGAGEPRQGMKTAVPQPVSAVAPPLAPVSAWPGRGTQRSQLTPANVAETRQP